MFQSQAHYSNIKYLKKIFFILLMSLFSVCLVEGNEDFRQEDKLSSHKHISDKPRSGISANPSAVNIDTGTGVLGKALGFKKNSGIRIGGLWIGDLNYLISGGVNPGKWSGNHLFQLSFNVDTDKRKWWKGGLFGIEFLQFNGRPTNLEAGTVQGYNSLVGPKPLDRSELYQFWYRQEFFNKKLILRIGKSIPTFDFNNVLKPIPLIEESLSIPATSGLIYTPIFINSTLLGVIPGYYNSAWGITATYIPVESAYFSYGVYDGNLARGKQTGLRGPQFNGYYFHIAEAGYAWMLGKHKMPGNIGMGIWYQSGKLCTITNRWEEIGEKGNKGFYLFGTQRLWKYHPDIDNSGIVGFFQLGYNQSKLLPINKYFGTGLTFFGLVPSRLKDSFGLGMALSKLNTRLFERKNELILQGYYQMYVFESTYFLTALSYIPRPGIAKDLSAAWAATARLISLF